MVSKHRCASRLGNVDLFSVERIFEALSECASLHPSTNGNNDLGLGGLDMNSLVTADTLLNEDQLGGQESEEERNDAGAVRLNSAVKEGIL
jgi:hypothetical protein